MNPSDGQAVHNDYQKQIFNEKKKKRKDNYLLKHYWHEWSLKNTKKKLLSRSNDVSTGATQENVVVRKKKKKNKARKREKKLALEATTMRTSSSSVTQRAALRDASKPPTVDNKRISFVDSANAIELFLPKRPDLGEVKLRGILKDPEKEAELRREKELARSKLNKRLSIRPSQEELLDKGILKRKFPYITVFTIPHSIVIVLDVLILMFRWR
jgi:hypothetical protein